MVFNMANKTHHFHFHHLDTIKTTIFALFILLHSLGHINAVDNRQGRWELLLNNVGVVAMHMAVTHQGTVVIFDQTQAGPSHYKLRRRFSSGRTCSRSGNDTTDPSCFAHSVEYDISRNRVRALRLDTDPWCSSGSFLSNGTLLQAGGNGRGSRRVRYFRPCKDHQCDWRQSRSQLSDQRWYASSLALPHDRVIVVGGRNVFSYEFVPKMSPNDNAFHLPLLSRTNDRNSRGNNLYPFLHLSADGNLFIFANRDSILFNYRRHRVIKTFPRMPGNGSRNYPSTGSSVILPLDYKNRFQKVEVMICGGASSGAYQAARERQRRYHEGLNTCGRMVITGNRHKWTMEHMPRPRLMSDMLILPTGEILIINGAESGVAGWDTARNASLRPFLYNPSKPLGRRFTLLRPTLIPRMYHSSAVLLPDGRVLVGGSNPHNRYTFSNVTYPTELRLQAFVPHYMDHQYHPTRPSNVTVNYGHGQRNIGLNGVVYGGEFHVRFHLGRRPSRDLEFVVYAPPFTTHSMSMNQRMLRLRARSMERGGRGWVNAVLEAPPSPNVAPSGYYMLTVVNEGIPSLSQWVRFIQN